MEQVAPQNQNKQWMIGLGSERIHSLCSWQYHQTYAFTISTYMSMKWYKVLGATG